MKHDKFLVWMFVVGLVFCIAENMNFAIMANASLRIESDEETIFLPLDVCETRICDTSAVGTDLPIFVSNDVCETQNYIIPATDEDIELMARVVMSESSILCFDAKVATAQTIVNRVRSNYKEFKYQNTVEDVVKRPKQYSMQNNGNVTQECYDAVYIALTEEVYPTDMLWFCKSSESYGNVYAIFGNGKKRTYFSTVFDYEEIVKEEMESEGH